jgi:hypothetical protein
MFWLLIFVKITDGNLGNSVAMYKVYKKAHVGNKKPQSLVLCFAVTSGKVRRGYFAYSSAIVKPIPVAVG